MLVYFSNFAGVHKEKGPVPVCLVIPENHQSNLGIANSNSNNKSSNNVNSSNNNNSNNCNESNSDNIISARNSNCGNREEITGLSNNISSGINNISTTQSSKSLIVLSSATTTTTTPPPASSVPPTPGLIPLTATLQSSAVQSSQETEYTNEDCRCV